jgi:hypothetical protein
MFHYRVFDVNVRSLPNEIDTEEFLTTWKSVYDKEQPLRTLLPVVKPFFDYWIMLAKDPTISKNINYSTLYQMLEGRGLDPRETLNYWIDSSEDPYVDLTYLLYDQFLKMYKYPTRAAPNMAEFVIAMDYRRRLGKFLRNIMWFRKKRFVDISPDEYIMYLVAEQTEMPDYLAIDLIHNSLNSTEKYLYELINRGVHGKMFERYTRRHYNFSYKKVEALWNKVKKIF